MSENDERIDPLFEEARETVEMIGTKADEDELGPVLSLLDDLEDIADEAEDILSAVDLTDIAATIDWEDLPEAVEIDDLRAAIDEGDASETVELRKLVELVDLRELWENVHVRELWREKREFEEELDDVTGGHDGRGRDTASSSDGSRSGFGDDGASDGDVDVDPASVETAIQSEISDTVAEIREQLLEAHDRLASLRQRNQERFPDRRRQRSGNPTAVSTIPSAGGPRRGGHNYSTVPEETRHSSVPNRQRIYGARFDSAGGDVDR